MKYIMLILALVFVVGCDDRSNIERIRDDKAACFEVGGTPELLKGPFKPFINCSFHKEGK